jgi:hypothetical protein
VRAIYHRSIKIIYVNPFNHKSPKRVIGLLVDMQCFIAIALSVNESFKSSDDASCKHLHHIFSVRDGINVYNLIYRSIHTFTL